MTDTGKNPPIGAFVTCAIMEFEAAARYGTGAKRRPAIVVAISGANVYLAGLTTLTHYGDGKPRVRLVPGVAGRDSYLWGGKLINARPDTIGAVIRPSITPAEAEVVIREHRRDLGADDIDALRMAARVAA